MNLFHDLPHTVPQEFLTILAETSEVRIERIVSHGHVSPPGFWYDQPQHEWVLLLRGEARLQFEEGDEMKELHPCDWIDIKAHRRHRVEWTSPNGPTIWLAVHYKKVK